MKFLTLLLLMGLCRAAPANARPQTREVWLNVDNYSDPMALVRHLNRALNAYPNARRFRLTWGLAFPHGGESGTLIYDKARRVLWISETQNGLWPQDEMEEDDAKIIYNASYDSQQWSFSRVTPNRLRLLFRRYGHIKWNREKLSDAAYNVSFFPRLSQFGCRGGLVGRTSDHWREKYIGGQRIRLQR